MPKWVGMAILLLGAPLCMSQIMTSGGKVCVARIANSSGKPVAMARLQDELMAQLQKRKLEAAAAPTMTLLANRLALSQSNREAMHALQCDFLMLSQVETAHSGEQLNLEFALFASDSHFLRRAVIPAGPADSPEAALPAAGPVAEEVARTVSRKKKKTRVSQPASGDRI